MGYNRFGLLLACRLLLILLCLGGLLYLILLPGYTTTTLLIALAAIGLSLETFRFVTKTNHELARFLDAVRYADFGQRFEFPRTGAGFEELGETFTHIIDRFRDDRQSHESELRHLRALLEQVPVPLISVFSNEDVQLWNNAARRLFGVSHVSTLDDLEQFGDAFLSSVQNLKPGEKRLVPFFVDNLEQRLTLSASELTRGNQTERLISLQNIQSELDDMQLNAWQDLVRVLTHEIMNSITPVTSLAKTAALLVEDAKARLEEGSTISEELQDAGDALDTLANRSDGLMSFVSSYRQMTQMRPLDKTSIPVATLFADLERMLAERLQTSAITLTHNIVPESLSLHADKQMIEQVLLNLVINAEMALKGRETGRKKDEGNGHIQLVGRLNRRGGVTLDVIDDGPGIPEAIRDRIFVPFFTTRKEGSGVGLALSRQIMIAHHGTLSYAPAEPHGCTFTLVF